MRGSAPVTFAEYRPDHQGPTDIGTDGGNPRRLGLLHPWKHYRRGIQGCDLIIAARRSRRIKAGYKVEPIGPVMAAKCAAAQPPTRALTTEVCSFEGHTVSAATTT